jgi:hypothetical protein
METAITPTRMNKSSRTSIITAVLSPISYCGFVMLLTVIVMNEPPQASKAYVFLFYISALAYVIVPFIFAAIAVWTGIKGLGQIKESGERGKGLAIAGIVVGSFIVLVFLCLLLSVMSILVQYVVSLI